jgi:phospholipid/cholesterol/gamma-HCH transport system substrate-binding protein
MSVPFRDRDPVVIGAAGLATMAIMLTAAFRADELPLIGSGDAYYAAFTESGGLKVNDEVRIAGVRTGKVEAMTLDHGHVRVEFRIEDGARFGRETTASIKVATMLGKMYLSLRPQGSGQLEEGSEIPLERTSSPYTVVEAFSGLAETSTRIDTGQLTQALTTLTELTRNTPDEFRRALAGIAGLSHKLAARDDQINLLLRNLKRVSHVLGERDVDLVGVMRDADVLFRALVQRRLVIHRLLVATSDMSRELSLLIRDSKADLQPALANLDTVVSVLLKNQDNLDEALRLYAPFLRMFTNVTGDGPWLDGYIQNIPPVPAGS